MLKLRGREVGSEDRVLFAGQSAVGHQVWQRGWDGGQRRSRVSHLLPSLGPD